MSTSSNSSTPQSSVKLPPTFSNSFWSSDYRSGITSIYTALQAGCVQSQEVLGFIRERVETERQISIGLIPNALREDGFGADEGASLRMGYEASLTSAVGESKARTRLADELMNSVYLPFSKWSQSHSLRISNSRQTVESTLESWEKQKLLVEKQRELYTSHCRSLDELEDELEFVRGREALLGSNGQGDKSLPPRPFEVDGNPTSLPLPPNSPNSTTTPTRSRSIRFMRGEKDEEGSEDGDEGLPPIDNGYEEEGFIDRTGATGGSVVSALGRALTVRGKRLVGSARGERGVSGEGEKEGDEKEKEKGLEGEGWKVEKIMEDKNVKAAMEFSKTKFSSLLSRVAGSSTGEDRHLRLRKEVETCEERYKTSISQLDVLRLTLEEVLSTHLPYLQHCESDRLRACTSVLKSYHALLKGLPALVLGSLERVEQSLELIQTDKDLKLLIERRRTGPFQPRPIGFASHYSEPYQTNFGIDLRKYDETNGDKEGGIVPKVLVVLLEEIERRMKDVENEDERRKSYLYETPLATQHTLRSLLNNPSILSLPSSELEPLFANFDLPVLCSVVKLWLLELEVPVINFSAYEELRGLFPGRIGGGGGGGGGEEGVKGIDQDHEGLVKVLARLPKIHLETLHLIFTHLLPLLALTPTEGDSPQTYLSKLSLSFSRPLMRPKQETALTLDERFPVVVVGELLKGGKEMWEEIENVAKKEREERYKPRRQRTKPVDVRPSRSNLGMNQRESVDLGQASSILSQQHAQTQTQQQVLSPTPSSARDVAQKEPSLQIETTSLAPPVPIVQSHTEDYAASPMESHSAFPPSQEEEEDTHEQVSKSEVILLEDEKPSSNSFNPSTGATETPFSPPSTSDQTVTEEPFVPPPSSSSSSSPILSSSTNSTNLTMMEDKPLSTSTSLKRQSGSAAAGGGASGGSGRLRGARAPRPISHSHSGSASGSVFDKVKAFEGGQ